MVDMRTVEHELVQVSHTKVTKGASTQQSDSTIQGSPPE